MKQNYSEQTDCEKQFNNNEGQTENTFSFTYSAKEQDEVRRIRDKYIEKETDKLTRLRMLDKQVIRKGRRAALIVGITGALILGAGMSIMMTELGEILGIGQVYIPGIILGLIGLALTAYSWPLYRKITKKEREKLAPEILRLTEELIVPEIR